MLQCPYCEEDAETCGHWDSFDDCRLSLGKIAPMVSDLKARVVELEKSDSETVLALTAKVASLSAHETCGCSVDTPEDICMHHSPEVMWLRKRVAELEAEVARLQVVELPEINNHPKARKMWNLGLATLGGKGYKWSKEAQALVDLLNEGRKV